MVGLGIGVFFFGYWTLAYGWSQLQHQNAGFFQIVWPGAYAKNLAPADSGGGGGGGGNGPLGSKTNPINAPTQQQQASAPIGTYFKSQQGGLQGQGGVTTRKTGNGQFQVQP